MIPSPGRRLMCSLGKKTFTPDDDHRNPADREIVADRPVGREAGKVLMVRVTNTKARERFVMLGVVPRTGRPARDLGGMRFCPAGDVGSRFSQARRIT